MNKINNNYQFFKSAVAFFFLFFLYGFSIGNGQQGISYNVCGLLSVVEFEKTEVHLLDAAD